MGACRYSEPNAYDSFPVSPTLAAVEMPVKAVTDGAALAPRQPAWTVGEEQGGRADERSPLLMPVPAPLLTPSTSGLPVSALAT